MTNPFKTEPVRLYSLAVAVLALVSHYVADLPTPLLLAVVAALLGVGQAVRGKVTPTERVVVIPSLEELFDDGEI